MGVHAEIDTIFNKMSDLFQAGKFEEAGEVIKALDLESLSTTIIIAWMSICLLPKNNGDILPNYQEFLDRCVVVLTAREPADRLPRLLKGLV